MSENKLWIGELMTKLTSECGYVAVDLVKSDPAPVIEMLNNAGAPEPTQYLNDFFEHCLFEQYNYETGTRPLSASEIVEYMGEHDDPGDILKKSGMIYIARANSEALVLSYLTGRVYLGDSGDFYMCIADKDGEGDEEEFVSCEEDIADSAYNQWDSINAYCGMFFGVMSGALDGEDEANVV